MRFLALALAVLLLALPAQAQVRKNVNSLTATELAAVRTAFRVMTERNSCARNTSCYRTSLEFWARMHGHVGADCAPAFGGVAAVTAIHPAERDTWCQCEHRSGRFLPWHRIFMAHFERVFTAASGMPGLRLPYWDSATLPVAFRSATVNGQPNPLYRAGRRMTGDAALSSGVRSTSNAMAATTYASFNQRLESSPHGAIHTAVGGVMGNVATAGLDPIFWLHHSRIDRDFETWLRRSGQRPTTDLDRVYRMLTVSGGATTARVRDWLTLRTPYDSYPAAPMSAMAVQRSTLRVTILDDPAPGMTYAVVHVAPNGERTEIGYIDGFATVLRGGMHSADRVYEFDATGLVGEALQFEPVTGLEDVGVGVVAGVRHWWAGGVTAAVEVVR